MATVDQNQAQFESQIGEWGKKLKINSATLQKKLTFDIHADILRGTPVDTGRARANWMVTVGAPSTIVTDAVDPEGAMPPPDLQLDGTRDTFIINNLSYIEALEHGHSQQAPLGMVRLALEANQAFIEQKVAEIRGNS